MNTQNADLRSKNCWSEIEKLPNCFNKKICRKRTQNSQWQTYFVSPTQALPFTVQTIFCLVVL